MTGAPRLRARPSAGSAEAASSSSRVSWRRWTLRALSVLTLFLLWNGVSAVRLRLPFVSFANLPAPAEVAEAFLALANTGKLQSHIAASLTRVLAGYFLAATVGVVVGVLVARGRSIEDIVMPTLELARPIPAVAWIPLAILMFPSSEASMIFITFTGALFPILLNSIDAVREVDRRLIASARSLGANETTIIREIVIPGAMPGVVTGLSIGMGTCWFCLVTAEMISGQLGIGYYTWESYTLQNYPDIVVGMLVIGVLGSASSAAVRGLGAVVMPWRRKNS
ncbi:ABC transporter permease [Methylosinus sp. Sm6]|uniref:ABC transporter permease n=1 Tax=Methylosinus sp. Sm6 TaxID=2866948 RepID=UPI001C99B753|nr:ABC transporter permease [Methylosinus sp. Sm6]MBY6243081.1 ABC transporter permease [Methylosinus sp. Sm6]